MFFKSRKAYFQIFKRLWFIEFFAPLACGYEYIFSSNNFLVQKKKVQSKSSEKLDLDKFPVRWEVLEPLITMNEAQAQGALLLHKNRKNNILTQGYVARGNVQKGFKRSKYIAQSSFTTPFIEHALSLIHI